MGYKQIVFDVDGTLIDTEYAVIHSLQDTIRAINGKIISDKELTFALGITGENALQRLGVSDIASALFMWDKNMEKYRLLGEETVLVPATFAVIPSVLK